MSTSLAEVVVQWQLDAYNRRDLEAVIATCADDAQQFEHPDTLLASGAAHIKERLRVRFQEPKLHAQLLHRIVKSGLEPRTETREGTKETGQLVGEG